MENLLLLNNSYLFLADWTILKSPPLPIPHQCRLVSTTRTSPYLPTRSRFATLSIMSDDDSDSDSDRSVGATRDARLDQLIKVGLSPVDTSRAAFKYERRGFDNSGSAATEGARSVQGRPPSSRGSQLSFGGVLPQPNSSWDDTPGASRPHGSRGGVSYSRLSFRPQPPTDPSDLEEHEDKTNKDPVPPQAVPYQRPRVPGGYTDAERLTAMQSSVSNAYILNQKNLSWLSAIQTSYGGQGGEIAQDFWEDVANNMAILKRMKKQYKESISKS